MTDVADILVVGGGLGAAHTVEALRGGAFEGSIVLASDEGDHPYDRPPLSKGVLGGTAPVRTLLSPERAATLRVDVRLHHPVTRIVREEQQVVCADGSRIGYGRLVVATGARPRPLPLLVDAPGVRVLRTLQDSRWLADRLSPGRRLVIVGAGFVGLEVAATARGRGAEVSVVEAAAAPLERAVGPELAGWLVQRHVERGVDLRCGVTVTSWRPDGDRTVLGLSDGSELTADAVVVGIGIMRDLDWLAAAGLEVHDGLVVDTAGRTNDPAIRGVGDITCVHTGDACRVTQHWTATTAQAARVARSMLDPDAEPVEDEEAYVWSDQYEFKVQLVGRTAGAEPSLVESTPEAFLAEYRDAGRLVGAAAVNRPRDLVRQRAELRQAAAVSGAGAGGA